MGNWDRPTALSDVGEFLQGCRQALEGALREIIPAEAAAKLGLRDGTWVRRLTDSEGRLALAVDEVVSDHRQAKRLEHEAAEQGDYSTAHWARTRALTIANEDLLSFLSRKAIIPKYGFPVDVVELDTHRADSPWTQEAANVALQRDLQIAISEFAPSAEVIADKKIWKSYGLRRVLERTWPIYAYKLCRRHNTFVQWERGAEDDVPSCGCAVRSQSYVVPRFGFITKREKPRDPQGRPARLFSTRPYFAGGLGPAPARLSLPGARGEMSLPDLTPASPGRMVVLCEGRRGGGFYICLQCGAGDSKHRWMWEAEWLSESRSLEGRNEGAAFLADRARRKAQGEAAEVRLGSSARRRSGSLGEARPTARKPKPSLV